MFAGEREREEHKTKSWFVLIRLHSISECECGQNSRTKLIYRKKLEEEKKGASFSAKGPRDLLQVKWSG